MTPRGNATSGIPMKKPGGRKAPGFDGARSPSRRPGMWLADYLPATTRTISRHLLE